MERLRRMRTEKGLSQARLAARAGLDPSTVNQIERGAREASPATLRKLADALDVGIADLLEEASPKGGRHSSAEPSLFNGIGEERRESVYGPWLEFVNRYSERWEQQLETGDFDLGRINEFIDVVGELVPVLRELNARELEEFPVEGPYSFGGREALTGRAIWRILDFLQPLVNAADAKFANSDLEQLRRRREEMLDEQARAASG